MENFSARNHQGINSVRVGLAKLFYDVINQSSLRQVDRTNRFIVRDNNAEGIFDIAKIGDILVGPKFIFEEHIFISRGGNRDNIVNVYSKDNNASSSLSSIDTPFTSKTLEAKL